MKRAWMVAAMALVSVAAMATALPQAGTMVEDRGKFRVIVDGQQAGTEEFQIAPSGQEWVARGRADVKPAGAAESHVTATLSTRADGTPLRYEWSIEGNKKAASVVTFENGKAQLVLNLPGAPAYTQEFVFPTAKVAILDNNMYHQYALLARLYDWSAKGEQTIPVLIPQDMTPGVVMVTASGPQQAEGKTYEGMKVRTADIEIELYFEPKSGNAGPGKLMRIAVPAAKAIVVRE